MTFHFRIKSEALKAWDKDHVCCPRNICPPIFTPIFQKRINTNFLYLIHPNSTIDLDSKVIYDFDRTCFFFPHRKASTGRSLSPPQCVSCCVLLAGDSTQSPEKTWSLTGDFQAAFNDTWEYLRRLNATRITHLATRYAMLSLGRWNTPCCPANPSGGRRCPSPTSCFWSLPGTLWAAQWAGAPWRCWMDNWRMVPKNMLIDFDIGGFHQWG